MRENARAASRFNYGWVVVGAGFIIMSVAFIIQSSFTIFFKPLQESFGWSRATTSWAMTVHLIVFSLCIMPVGWALDRFKTQAVYVVGSVIIGTSLVLASLISQAWQLYFLYGILGAGISICGPTLLGFVTRWFSKNRGLALGIASAGTGMGTLLGAPLANWLIGGHGWRDSFVIMGASAFVILLVCAFWVRSAPPVAGMDSTKANAVPPRKNAFKDIVFRKALGSRELVLLMMAQGFLVLATRMVTVHMAPYATDVGISVGAAALAIGVMGIFSALGRFVMGFVQDRIGARVCSLMCLSVQAVCMLLLPFIRGEILFFVFAVVFGFVWGGDVPQIPALTAQCFGLGSIVMLYGMVLTIGNLMGALGPIAAGYVFDITGSYAVAFGGSSILLVAGVFCIWRLRIKSSPA